MAFLAYVPYLQMVIEFYFAIQGMGAVLNRKNIACVASHLSSDFRLAKLLTGLVLDS